MFKLKLKVEHICYVNKKIFIIVIYSKRFIKRKMMFRF